MGMNWSLAHDRLAEQVPVTIEDLFAEHIDQSGFAEFRTVREQAPDERP
jgi:hypothetical protein